MPDFRHNEATLAALSALLVLAATAIATLAFSAVARAQDGSTVINPHCDGTVNVDGTYPVAPEGTVRWSWTVNGVPGSAIDDDGDLMGYHFVVPYEPVLPQNQITVWYFDNNNDQVTFSETWTCDLPDPTPTETPTEPTETPTEPSTESPTPAPTESPSVPPTDPPSPTTQPPTTQAPSSPEPETQDDPTKPPGPTSPAPPSPQPDSGPDSGPGSQEPPTIRHSCTATRCVTTRTEPDGSTSTRVRTYPPGMTEEGL